VVVHRENSEHSENGERHNGLDCFRPPESKPYVQYVVELVVNGEVPLNGAQGRLIWPAG
jgi:hypothetical protein